MDHLQLLSPQRLARALGAFLVGLLVALIAVPAMALTKAQLPLYAVVEDGPFLKLRVYSTTHGCGGSYPAGWEGAEEGYIQDATASCGWTYVLRRLKCTPPQILNSTTYQCENPPPPDCAPGQVRNTVTQECQPPCHAAGTAGGSAYVSPWTDLPRAICRDGCKLNVGGTGHHIPWSNGTTLHVVNGLVHTGEFCSGDINGEGEGNGEDETYEGPDDPDPIKVTPEDDPPRCGPGQCPGEFNGVHMCVSCTDIASPEKPVTTYDRKTETTTTGTPPNQTTETKTTDTKATHDGSGTVTSTTTTSTTKTDANGTTTTEEGKTEKKESQESFCKENPTVAFCKNGKWGGSCNAFTCDGDAVQCAIAKEIHQRNCDMNTPNEYSNAAEKAGTGTETGEQYLQTEKEREGLDVQGKFTSEVRASPIAAACPAPRVVPLPGGNSLEISFEKPCEVASQLGAFVVAFAYLAAALIVLKSPGGA